MDYLSEAQEVMQVGEPARCAAGSGAGWIGSAWRLFKQSWLEFLVAIVLLIVIRVGLELLPMGAIAAALLMPVLLAGFLDIAHRTHTDTGPEITQLFAGFQSDKRTQLGRLVLLGVVSLLFTILLVLVMVVAMLQLMGGLGGLETLLQQGAKLTPQDAQALAMSVLQQAGPLLVWMLVISVVVVIYSCAVWFATPLIWFADRPVLEAMCLSLKACQRNWLALLVFGLLVLVLAIIALIPFGLGFLVLIPVLLISNYTAFRQIFVDHGEKM